MKVSAGIYQLKVSKSPCSSVSIVNFEQVIASWGDFTNLVLLSH